MENSVRTYGMRNSAGAELIGTAGLIGAQNILKTLLKAELEGEQDFYGLGLYRRKWKV